MSEPEGPAELSFDEQEELERMLDAEADDTPPAVQQAVENTNSERVALHDRDKAMIERGLRVPAENAPSGLYELFKIILAIPLDTPDNHGLFAVVGNRFTVGGLRSLFPGVKKQTRRG